MPPSPRRSCAAKPVADAAIAAEIAPCFVTDGGRRTDTVVLACTHYPLLLERFERLAPWPVTWLDPAPAIARRVVELIGPAQADEPTGRHGAILHLRHAPSAALTAALGGFGIARSCSPKRFDLTPAFPPRYAALSRGPVSARVAFRDPRLQAGALRRLQTCRFRQIRDRGGRDPQHHSNTEDAMTKRNEAKYKIDRRMGQNIWGRPKSPVNRREYGPGQHGQRRKGKLSDFGVQLRAKQKLKGYYGNISEKQFRGIYEEAIRLKGDSGDNLIGLLERRLDAVVYRAKFVPTVFAARQFVNHGHVKVNGRRVNIPSYPREGRRRDRGQGSLASSSRSCSRRPQLAERDVPDYIEVDHSKMTAKFARMPQLTEVPYPVQMEPNLVVEFYSR